jgi:hypothetical protein
MDSLPLPMARLKSNPPCHLLADSLLLPQPDVSFKSLTEHATHKVDELMVLIVQEQSDAQLSTVPDLLDDG